MSADPLKDIQSGISAIITADSYFTGLPVITEAKGDILNIIMRALGKLGICIVIETLTGKPEHAAIGAYRLDLDVGITVSENVLINQGATGSKKAASAVVARLLCILNPNASRGVPAWAESFNLVDDSGGLLIYQIKCKAVAGFELSAE